MSLHDTDKHNNERVNPTPNHNDTLNTNAVKSHGTMSANYVTQSTSDPTTGVFGGTATLVQTGTTTVDISNLPQHTLNTTTVAHNLGYAPLVVAALNNAAINSSGSSNLFLPTWTSVAWATDASGHEQISFDKFMTFGADATNLYIYTLTAAATGSPFTYTVTYYLYQQAAIH